MNILTERLCGLNIGGWFSLPVDYFNFFKGEYLKQDNAAFEILDSAIDEILNFGLAEARLDKELLELLAS